MDNPFPIKFLTYVYNKDSTGTIFFNGKTQKFQTLKSKKVKIEKSSLASTMKSLVT